MNTQARILKFSLAGILCLSVTSCSGSFNKSEESGFLNRFSESCGEAVVRNNSNLDSLGKALKQESDLYTTLSNIQGNQPGLLLSYRRAVSASEHIDSVSTDQAITEIGGAIISSMNAATKIIRPEFWSEGHAEQVVSEYANSYESLPRACDEFDSAVDALGNE